MIFIEHTYRLFRTLSYLGEPLGPYVLIVRCGVPRRDPYFYPWDVTLPTGRRNLDSSIKGVHDSHDQRLFSQREPTSFDGTSPMLGRGPHNTQVTNQSHPMFPVRGNGGKPCRDPSVDSVLKGTIGPRRQYCHNVYSERQTGFKKKVKESRQQQFCEGF